MKHTIFLLIAVALLASMVLTGCKEPNYFWATVTADIESLDLAYGQQLKINNVTVTDAYITKGDDGERTAVTNLSIAHVDFYIANRKIHTDDTAPYTLDYTLADLPVGEHQLRVDAVVNHLPKNVNRDKHYQWGKRARVGTTYKLQVRQSAE